MKGFYVQASMPDGRVRDLDDPALPQDVALAVAEWASMLAPGAGVGVFDWEDDDRPRALFRDGNRVASVCMHRDRDFGLCRRQAHADGAHCTDPRYAALLDKQD